MAIRRLRRFWWLFLLIPLLAVGAFVLWAADVSPIMPEAQAAMQSDDRVEVVDGDWLVFRPVQADAGLDGVILYPGGKVDPRAYAPLARALAEDGLLVIIPRMPLNLAVLSPNVAADVMGVNSHVQSWIIGGHSLGGAMAAAFVAGHPGAAQGLFFLAAYPAENVDLSQETIPVVSIYASNDGVATTADVLAGAARLPKDARFVEIQGGNHAQFGWYGDQSGDNPATISREEQQAQVLQALRELIGALGQNNLVQER